MPAKRMKIANLDEDSLKKIKQMEAAMDSLILALEPHHPMAELDEAQIQKLSRLEEELGVVLLAYRP